MTESLFAGIAIAIITISVTIGVCVVVVAYRCYLLSKSEPSPPKPPEDVPHTPDPATIAKIAEYLALASQLDDTRPPEEYIRANQLSWELAMLLPVGNYKRVTEAIVAGTIKDRLLTVAYFSKEITEHEIAHHAPGIEREQSEIARRQQLAKLSKTGKTGTILHIAEEQTETKPPKNK